MVLTLTGMPCKALVAASIDEANLFSIELDQNLFLSTAYRSPRH